MSCNGCTALGKNCSDTCVLRSCLQRIKSPQAQANAVLCLSNYFGPDKLIALISEVPEAHRSVVFRSLLLEACGRLVNPVDGVVGMLGRAKFDVCKQAVATVLAGGTVTPIPYTPHQPPALTLGPGSSSKNDEEKTLDLFK